MANRNKIHLEIIDGVIIPIEYQDRYYASRNHKARIKVCDSCAIKFYDTSDRIIYKSCSDCRYKNVQYDESVLESVALLNPGRSKICGNCCTPFLDRSHSGARAYCRRCASDYSYDILEANKKNSINQYSFDAKNFIDQVKLAYTDNKSDTDISRELNITSDQVRYIRNRYLDLPSISYDTRRVSNGFPSLSSLTKDVLEYKIRTKKLSYEEIGNEYGVKPITIEKKRAELRARPKFDVYDTVPLTDIQYQYIIGHVLGDGCLLLENSGLAACFKLAHKYDHKDYTVSSQLHFDGIIERVADDFSNGKIRDLDYGFMTKSLTNLVDLFYQFYDPKLKISPKDSYKSPRYEIFENLTPLSLALWYQDDGSLDHDAACDIAMNFRDFDYKKMCQILSIRFNIPFYSVKRNDRLEILKVKGVEGKKKFFEIVSPYIHPKMSYKLPRKSYCRDLSAFEGSCPLSKIFNIETYKSLLDNSTDDASEYLNVAANFVVSQPFPYPEWRDTPLSALKEQISRNQIQSGTNHISSGGTYGLEYIDSIFTHRYTSNHEYKPSSVEAWKDPVWIKKALTIVGSDYNTPATLKKVRAKVMNLIQAPGHFKPTAAAAIYNYFKPKSVLDPMIGWGGRALAAMCCDVRKYVGIDLQKESVNGVRQIYQDFQSHTKTRIEVFHDDALKRMTNYHMEFDLILAGPPYFKAENYNGVTPSCNLLQWEDEFIDPFCEQCFRVLKKGGVLALHIFDTSTYKLANTFESICMKKGFKHTQILEYGVIKTSGTGRKQYVHIFKK